MIGIYFSGTGNTRHCVEKLTSLLDKTGACFPLEARDITVHIQNQDIIVFGYPTQFSNAPFFVRDFIRTNASLWSGKKILCVNTMGLFSGDGTGCTARLFRKYGATVLGGIQLKMPDSVCDSKLLKKTPEENHQILQAADERIEQIAEQIKQGSYPKEGLSFLDHLKGLFGQRLWFYRKTTGYTNKLSVSDACIGCGLCSRECPMQNLQIKNGKAVADNRCTMCYRCISRCPKQAITLLGKEVIEQCRYEHYTD